MFLLDNGPNILILVGTNVEQNILESVFGNNLHPIYLITSINVFVFFFFLY